MYSRYSLFRDIHEVLFHFHYKIGISIRGYQQGLSILSVCYCWNKQGTVLGMVGFPRTVSVSDSATYYLVSYKTEYIISPPLPGM